MLCRTGEERPRHTRTLRGHTGPNVTRDAIRYNAPPWPITHTHVHDTITHGEEHTSTKRFGEEVSEIVDGAHERTPNLVIFHQLAHEEVTTLDVLHPTVVLRVVGHIDGRLVVNEHVRGGIGTEP